MLLLGLEADPSSLMCHNVCEWRGQVSRLCLSKLLGEGFWNIVVIQKLVVM